MGLKEVGKSNLNISGIRDIYSMCRVEIELDLLRDVITMGHQGVTVK
jgi:hypothetical protein